tara:strand:- start:201 stop:854 length:654 start_codon:yes stop_codon:yes gene_type:complete
LDAQLNGKKMNKLLNQISFFTNFKTLIKDNLRSIIIFAFILLLFFLGQQIYSFFNNQKIHKLSILYEEAKNSNSENKFLKDMKIISDDKSFFSYMAKLEIIKNKIKNKNYNESYEDYIILLNDKNLNNLYKTSISINASYNLLNHIDNNKILNLLSYVDQNINSFFGYYLEILYLLYNNDNNKENMQSTYDQIMNNENIHPNIKNRVKTINDFEKYK